MSDTCQNKPCRWNGELLNGECPLCQWRHVTKEENEAIWKAAIKSAKLIKRGKMENKK